jgi:hypothetical protein
LSGAERRGRSVFLLAEVGQGEESGVVGAKLGQSRADMVKAKGVQAPDPVGVLHTDGEGQASGFQVVRVGGPYLAHEPLQRQTCSRQQRKPGRDGACRRAAGEPARQHQSRITLTQPIAASSV